MRCARLHGIGDLRVEILPDPVPARDEVLVEIEACGICPTDLRKYLIGTSDGYPLNPGHEWLGHIVAVGDDASATWAEGDRVYGDTYAGYADQAVIAIAGNPWSIGPFRVSEGVSAVRASFLEPLADCVHAVRDQGRVEPGQRVTVIGAGQMGLQLVAAAADAGAVVTCVETDPDRLVRAPSFGAVNCLADLDDAEPTDCVILSIGIAKLVPRCVDLCLPGGRIVLFAGFGDQPRVELDMNAIHYRELAIVGSEWVGTPPHVHPERYADALRMIEAGLPVETLVGREVGLDDVEDVYRAMQSRELMKAILKP